MAGLSIDSRHTNFTRSGELPVQPGDFEIRLVLLLDPGDLILCHLLLRSFNRSILRIFVEIREFQQLPEYPVRPDVYKRQVCTCLNPLHTALAIFGCLLGYDLISKEMQDVTLKKLVKEIGYTEGLPVVINPGILDPKEFIDTVLNVRIPNSFMPDTPQPVSYTHLDVYKRQV